VQLIEAWNSLKLPDWELHFAGQGEMTNKLQELAGNNPTIVFHGLLDRKQNAELLSTARLCIVPRDLDEIPGNVFAFKTIECLAAGVHVITTPMGSVEPELTRGLTVMVDNSPATIAATLKTVIAEHRYENTAADAALARYGAAAVSNALNSLIKEVMHRKNSSARFQEDLRSPLTSHVR
jgi:glycosyltransferase involved in cell wall biosynthesis